MAQLATHQNWKSKILPSTDSYLHAKTLRVLIDSSQRHQSNWVRATTGHTQPKLVVSDPSFCRWLSSCKKYKVWIDFFQWYWWSKEPTVSLNQRHNWLHLTKSSSPRSFLPLVVVSMQKINGIHLFFAEILMIAVYCNLIEHEAQLATPKQKWWSQIQLFVDSYLRVKIWSIEWLLPKILMIKEYCNLISWQHFKALTELSDFFQACDFHTGSNLGSECNYRFLQIPFFWASGGNLGLKGPANSCKQVGFATGVQGNPSAEEQLK